MRRFTIAGLMAVILVCGVAVAALRDASDTWAGLLLMLTLFLLGSAAFGIRYRRDGKQAFWFGFALFGWGYLVLSQAPWFADQVGPRLPTTQLLNYAHARVNPESPQSAANLLSRSLAVDLGIGMVVQPNPNATPTVSLGGVPAQPNQTSFIPAVTPQKPLELSLQLVAIGSNLEQFTRIGHCLFALMAALIGGLAARWFQRTGRSAQTTAAS